MWVPRCQGQGECQCGFKGAKLGASRRDSFRALEVVSCPVALSSTWEPNFGPRVPFFFVSHPTFGLWPFRGRFSFWASEHVSSPKTQYLFIKSRNTFLFSWTHHGSWNAFVVLGSHFCIPKLVFWCLIPILGAHLAPSAHPGQTERLGATGARSSVHPRRPEHAPRCTRPTCERRSLRLEVVCGHRVADGTLHAHDAPSRCTHVGRAGCTPDALARCAHPGRAHTWRTGRTSRGRVCTSTGVGGRGGFARGSRFAKYTLRQAHNGCDHTSVSAPDPIRTPQLSAAWAGVVLGWVTSREVPVLHPFLVFRRASQCYLNKPFARLRSRRGQGRAGVPLPALPRAQGATPSAHPRRPEHTGHGATGRCARTPVRPRCCARTQVKSVCTSASCALGRVAHSWPRCTVMFLTLRFRTRRPRQVSEAGRGRVRGRGRCTQLERALEHTSGAHQ
ncbi:hypothetical protein SUGI_1305650 [Cryptomeria japonica]|uniref:Uncharacterized protein n=1 Tax=Cryptomeria japonica TaxID=3369 RepID=A0AAD3NT62_CRYJA|nr:hypothetical protein SUGI_1305650 [Cryptomeria japonica]